MNVTASQLLRKVLLNAGLADLPVTPPVSGQWPITIGNMPSGKDVSDNYLMIRGTGGWIESRVHSTGKDDSHPMCQIWTRSLLHSDAELKSRRIEKYLATLTEFVVAVNGYNVLLHSVVIKTPTAWVKQEEQNQRQLYVVNVQLTMSED